MLLGTETPPTPPPPPPPIKETSIGKVWEYSSLDKAALSSQLCHVNFLLFENLHGIYGDYLGEREGFV